MTNRCLLAGCLVVALSACGVSAPTKTASNLPPEEAVAKRAVERWEHIIALDFRSAYDYLTPGARSVLAYDEYAARLGTAQLKWEAARVSKIECEDADACKAEMELDILVRAPGVGEISTKTYVQEDWLSSGGEWFFLPRQAR